MDTKEKYREGGHSEVDLSATFFGWLHRMFSREEPVKQLRGGHLSSQLEPTDELTELKATLTALRRSYDACSRLKNDTSFIQAQIDDIEARIKCLSGGRSWFG